jgi:hypothetical protein
MQTTYQTLKQIATRVSGYACGMLYPIDSLHVISFNDNTSRPEKWRTMS